jgi:hypothetical protein
MATPASEAAAFAGFEDSLDHAAARGHNEAEPGSRWTLCPTFKTQRHVPVVYNSQRVPAFCDRILWRSAPGRTQCLSLVDVCAEPDIRTSDHMPLYANFLLSVRGLRPRSPAGPALLLRAPREVA